MPGTVVRDAEAPNLLAGVTTTTTAGANQAGTAYEAGWSRDTQFVLNVTAKGGTTPNLTVDIQGSETSAFNSKVVTLATITAVDPATPSTFSAETFVDSRFVRAVSTVTGTSGTVTATLTPVPKHDRRVRGASPSAKAVIAP
jgi:hypothetical protein